MKSRYLGQPCLHSTLIPVNLVAQGAAGSPDRGDPGPREALVAHVCKVES
jgi:hypothetical protein